MSRVMSVNEEATVRRMALAWHEVSDHRADGTRFRGLLCNCEGIARRAVSLGWSDDDR